MKVTNFLPQTKYQLIGFVVWIISQLLIDFWLGKTNKIKASSIVEACILTVSAAVIAGIGLFKKEKKNESGTPPSGH